MLHQVSVSELNSIPKKITGPHYILQTFNTILDPEKKTPKEKAEHLMWAVGTFCKLNELFMALPKASNGIEPPLPKISINL